MLSTDNALLLLIVTVGIVVHAWHGRPLGAAALTTLRATLRVATFLPLFSGKALWRLTRLAFRYTSNTPATKPASKKRQHGEWVWIKTGQRVVSNRDIEALVFDILERVVQDRRYMACAVRAYKNGKPQGVLFQHRNGASELLTVKGWKDVSGDFQMFAPEQRVRLTHRPAPPEEPPHFLSDPYYP